MDFVIVSFLSKFFRMFIDNPLESLISYSNLTIEGFFDIIFIIKYWPLIMGTLTYWIVGGIYKKGEFPALGSALYLFTFWVNSKLLKFLVSLFGVYGLTAAIIPFLVICLLEFIMMHKLRVNIVDELYI